MYRRDETADSTDLGPFHFFGGMTWFLGGDVFFSFVLEVLSPNRKSIQPSNVNSLHLLTADFKKNEKVQGPSPKVR